MTNTDRNLEMEMTSVNTTSESVGDENHFTHTNCSDCDRDCSGDDNSKFDHDDEKKIKMKNGTAMNDNKFVKILKRFTILTVFSMIFTLLLYFFYAIVFIAEVELFVDYETWILFFYTNQFLDHAVNVICLFIQFDFIGKHVYYHSCRHCEKICNINLK